MTLEKRIAQLLAEAEFPEGTTFKVLGCELTREEDGWSFNDYVWLASEADTETLLMKARDRWEVYKANYDARARVKDLDHMGEVYGDTVYINCDHNSFLEIRATRPAITGDTAAAFASEFARENDLDTDELPEEMKAIFHPPA